MSATPWRNCRGGISAVSRREVVDGEPTLFLGRALTPWGRNAMVTKIDRKTFLGQLGTVVGGYAIAAPLQALAARSALGQPITGDGYGELVNKGDLWLPEAFEYKIISRQGDLMSDGNPTPSRFDGMSAFKGPDRTTVLIRNHENKRRFNMAGVVVTPANEIDVVLPNNRYDPNPMWNGGVTKVVVSDREVIESYAVLAGTTHNCAGGELPWGSWVTCEELFQPPPGSGTMPHGYIFEVNARPPNLLPAVPITNAGRFEHEAVAWKRGLLYETEDRPDAAFYRFVPDEPPEERGDLASVGGVLQALKVTDHPNLDTRLAGSWPGGVGSSLHVEWVDIPNPDPATDGPGVGVRYQAQGLGAAIFARTEGCWPSRRVIFFDCTTGGGTSVTPPNGNGQIFMLDPQAETLTLLYESALTNPALVKPDNMTLTKSGELFLCEDTAPLPVPNHVRGLTPDGLIFDFAKAQTNPTEFCGVCFDHKEQTMYLNQQGSADGAPGVTYAIWGPWSWEK
jgi:secreted PhoX family phosphatase